MRSLAGYHLDCRHKDTLLPFCEGKKTKERKKDVLSSQQQMRLWFSDGLLAHPAITRASETA